MSASCCRSSCKRSRGCTRLFEAVNVTSVHSSCRVRRSPIPDAAHLVLASLLDMDLRSGTRTAPLLQLSPEAKAGFEEGVGLIFSQWTALVLAVENLWGGPDSATKADYFIEDIIEWFYKKKEHFADDLEMELADGLLEDFQVEAEDGSPAQVAKSLIELYTACARNDASVLQQLRQRQVSGAAASKKQVVDLDGAEIDDSSSDADSEGGSDMDQDMQEAAPAVVPMKQPVQPVIDEDGFELVQKRKGKR